MYSHMYTTCSLFIFNLKSPRIWNMQYRIKEVIENFDLSIKHVFLFLPQLDSFIQLSVMNN